ncbi:MAG: alpha/beta fold hydrolase [Flavobacteriaceae bacterium]|nr:alpha/beta fold hydrolase [Flavobacteriaceae bacterium]
MMNLKYIDIPDFKTQSGKTADILLSYQVFGQKLDKGPIVLVNHALTGNSNVAGEDGWWNKLIGENKVIDTNYYSVMAFNIPGNGFDGTNKSLIGNYKDFNALDIANMFAIGLDKLNINNLFAVIGGSVGGGLAWELAILRPNLIENLIPVAADWKSTDWIIANCFIQDNILNNSNRGLEDARAHAMTLYRTPESFTNKFERSLREQDYFNVESWLNYHGNELDKRFQLSAYKMMNQILKTIDITRDGRNFIDVVSSIKSNIHIVTINSDLFFKAEENWKTYVDLKSVKNNVTIGEIKSIHGHDAFLIEYNQLNNLLKPIFQAEKENELIYRQAI